MSSYDRMLQGKIPGTETGIDIKKSICTICDPLTQCGLNLYVKKGKIIKVEGSKENPNNEGTLCSKGAATRQYVYHKDRLQTPLVRTGKKGTNSFAPISWEEALDLLALKLNKYKEDFGPETVAFYAGYTKWMRPFLQRLTHSFGSPNYLTESSTCARAMTMAQQLVYGTPTRTDMANTKCLLVWSSNPFYSNTCLARKILDAKENGLKIITVDPRYTPMTAQADIHLQLKPGTDGALALTMANFIIEEGLYDEDFINNYSYGFEEFRNYIKEFTCKKGEEITGVSSKKIKAAAYMYATTKPAAIMPSASAVVHHTNGIQNYRAVFTLAGLTGNFDVKGGNFVEPPSYNYIPGGFKSRTNEFILPRKWSEMAPRIGEEKFPVWSELINEGQAMDLPFQIQSGKPYPLKALIAFGINYRMWPDSTFMAESLSKLDFVINVDLFMTDSCKYADLVLPACSSVERSELRCYPQNYIIYTQPAVKPLYESRSDADIIYEIANKLDLDDPLFKAGYEASMDWILEPSGLTIEELKKHPTGMPVPNPIIYSERKYLERGFATPSGKMEFKSLILDKYEDKSGYDGLPKYIPPKNYTDSSLNSKDAYPFILNTGSRLPMFIHSRTFRLSWTQALRPEAAADINFQDAKSLGIEQSDSIKIITNKGEITVKANLTGSILPGVVHMYHAYPEADVNKLIEADYLDPISGYPGFKSLLCKIEKVFI